MKTKNEGEEEEEKKRKKRVRKEVKQENEASFKAVFLKTYLGAIEEAYCS